MANSTQKRDGFIRGALRVFVTEALIKNSETQNSSHCMIAEAIKESIPYAAFVACDMLTLRYTDPTKGLRYTYLTPATVARAIIQFDQGVPQEPFSFELRKPAQVRRAGWKAAHPGMKARVKDQTEKCKKTRKAKVLRNGTVSGGRAIPQMSTRREFGARLFVR